MNKKLHCKNFFTKFFLVLLVLCSSQYRVNANIYDDLQRKEVTINMQNKLVKDLLNEIQKQTNLNFVYNEDELSSNIQKSLNVKNQSVEDVLSNLFSDTNLTYKIVGNTITVIKKAATPQPQQQPKAKFNVSGKVVEEGTKRPVIGATVIVLGTTSGAITDSEGKFDVKATAGDQIEISFTGMLPIKITANATNNKNLIIEMKFNAVNVDDVIITGIFNKAKESYTGSVTTVTAKDLKNFKGQNLINTLKNFDPSLNVISSNEFGSNPNILPEVNIRGNSSLPQSVKELNENAQAQLNAPLVIMDGFRVSLQKLMDFNDEEIETISILKDASATAIYGSEGSNGVIVVTTKLPQAGKIKIYAQIGINIEVPDLSSYDLMNAREKLTLENYLGFYDAADLASDISSKAKYYNLLDDVNRGVDTYWLSKPLQTGVGQKYNARLEGGSQEFRWSTSIGYNNIAGVMKGSFRNTFTGDINLSYNIKNIIFKNQTMITQNNTSDGKYGNFGNYTKMNAYWKPYDDNGNLIKTYSHIIGYGSIQNPLYNASLNTEDKTSYFEVINNFSVEWNIIDALKVRAKFGLSKKINDSDVFKSAKHTDFNQYDGSKYFRKGKYTYGVGNGVNYDGNITISYSKTFAEKHQLYVGIDASMKQSDSFDYKFIAEGFPNDNLSFIANALQYEKNSKPSGSESTSRSVGFTGNANYTYNNRYFADFSYRIDGSSQFGTKNRFAPFWSIGIGWNLHRENFLKESKVVNNLRIKGSYGITGAQQFSSYQAIAMYQDLTNDRYVMWNGSSLMGLGNENLKWQNTNSISGGFEVGLFSNRVTASLDLYNRITSNLLSQMDIPLSTGFSSYTANVGEVTNSGFEAMVSTYIIRNSTSGIMWSVTGKLAYNKNKITELSEAIKIQNQVYLDKKDANLERLIFEGDSQNSIYVVPSLGIDPSTGQELFLNKDGSVGYTWDSRNRMYAGINEPAYRGNISSMFVYKNLSLNLSFGYHWGGQQYNQTLVDRIELDGDLLYNNVDRRVYSDRWKKIGDVARFKAFKEPNGATSDKTKYSSRFVEDDNVFSMQNISLQYRWSSKWLSETLKMQSINLSMNMSDIFYISTIKRERGLQYPFSRRASFSVSFMF